MLAGSNVNGVVFAYDEAQNLGDHATEKEYDEARTYTERN